MRTWTIFLIFGVLALGVVIYSLITSYSQSKSPTMQTTQKFLQAIANNDIATLKQITDPAVVTIQTAGDKVSGISFAQNNTFSGVFSSNDAKTMSYIDLTKLSVMPDMQPEISGDKDKLASVTMKDYSILLLHQVKGEWKVFYITDAKEPTK